MKNKQLRINLDEIKNPNPAIVKAFKDANAFDISFELGHTEGNDYNSPSWNNENRVFIASRSSKVPIRHKIISIYRIQKGRKEYCWFQEHLKTQDYFKNNVDSTRTVGKFELSHLVQHMAIDTSRIRSDEARIEPTAQPAEVENVTEEYEFEWNEGMKSQLLKWESEGIIDDNTKYYIQHGGRTYTKPYDLNEFLTFSLPDLLTLSNYANRISGLLKGETLTSEMIQIFREKLLKEELATPKTV